MNDEVITSTATTPTTSSYTAWTTVCIATANVVKGTNTFVIEILGNFANMNYIDFVVTGS